MDNLGEMNKFLEIYTLPKLNQEEAKNLNRPITTRDIEAVIKNLLTNKSPGPYGFTGKYDHTFKKELTPILQKLFQKKSRMWKTPKLFL